MRNVEADIELALRRGGSKVEAIEILRLIWSGKATLLIHPSGSMSWRWNEGRGEVLHVAGEATDAAVRWFLERLPRDIIWEGRPGWRRFLTMREGRI